MRFIANATLMLIICSGPAANANQSEQDQARIETIVQAIGIFADLGEFASICPLYDETSTSDYSSLWGNQPMVGSPSTKATGWSGFIPGFDTTRHDIVVDSVSVEAETATAVARVQADHWLDGQFWGISGTYTVGLVRRDDRWLISTWVFTLEDEVGSRQLVDQAEAIAADLVERPIVCDA